MTLLSHVRATTAIACITANLLLWSVPLVLALATRLIVPSSRAATSQLGVAIYRRAVVIDDWILQRVSNARWQDPALKLDQNDVIVVVANHRSWSDVLLLQSVIARRGPIVKFLSKRELVFVPIFALVFIVFDFPMLRRRAETPIRFGPTRRRSAACT